MADDQNETSGKDDAPLHVLYLDVGGMHCINCATLVEQRLANCRRCAACSVDYPQVAPWSPTRADSTSPICREPSVTTATPCRSRTAPNRCLKAVTKTPRDYFEIAAAFAILLQVWPCSTSRCFRAASRSPTR